MGLSKNKLQCVCVCVHVMMNMSPSETVWLTDVFLIVFGQQWSSAAHRNKTYQNLDTQVVNGLFV